MNIEYQEFQDIMSLYILGALDYKVDKVSDIIYKITKYSDNKQMTLTYSEEDKKVSVFLFREITNKDFLISIIEHFLGNYEYDKDKIHNMLLPNSSLISGRLFNQYCIHKEFLFAFYSHFNIKMVYLKIYEEDKLIFTKIFHTHKDLEKYINTIVKHKMNINYKKYINKHYQFLNNKSKYLM